MHLNRSVLLTRILPGQAAVQSRVQEQPQQYIQSRQRTQPHSPNNLNLPSVSCLDTDVSQGTRNFARFAWPCLKFKTAFHQS